MASNWDSKKVRSVLLDKYLVMFEKYAFGWRFASEDSEVYGTQSEYSITDDGIYETRTTLSEKYMTFVRPKGYAKGLFFRLFEFFTNIISSIRRFGTIILLPLAVIGGIVLILCKTACDDANGATAAQDALIAIGILYAVLVIPPLIFSIFGFLLRKLKRLDQKCASNYEEKITANRVNTCRKCGQIMEGAQYRYRYDLRKSRKSPYTGLYKVNVDVTIKCPHCGKEKYLPEVVDVVNVAKETVESAIEIKMQDYFE